VYQVLSGVSKGEFAEERVVLRHGREAKRPYYNKANSEKKNIISHPSIYAEPPRRPEEQIPPRLH
jgi:hypothetical protein